MQLVPTPIPPDIRQAGRDIYELAESGELTGLGVVVVLKGGRYFVDAFGTMVRNPGPARGFVLDLLDCLGEIGRQRRGRDTTM
jgi:hypothetical protein